MGQPQAIARDPELLLSASPTIRRLEHTAEPARWGIRVAASRPGEDTLRTAFGIVAGVLFGLTSWVAVFLGFYLLLR